MEEPVPQQPSLTPNQTPEHHLAARRVKRRLMAGLIALYAASIVAGTVVAVRRGAGEADRKKTEKRGFSLGAQKDVVGWVTISGPIYASESGRPWDKGSDQWSRRIKALAESKDVKAIVLDINSPGGSVGAVQEIYMQVLRVRREKKIPVIALFGDVAASGGYYIAAACDKIVAHPGTLTGSIGVIFSVSNLEGLFSKVGYKTEAIKSGKHKDIGSPARPMTPEERKILQNLIDDAYGQFVVAVSSGRNLPEDRVREIADGRIYSGRQALDLSLVDQLGDSTDALQLAAKMGGISGKPRVKRDMDGLGDILQMLESRFSGTAEVLSAFKPHTSLLEYRWQGF